MLVAYPRVHFTSFVSQEHLFRQFQHGYCCSVLVLSFRSVFHSYVIGHNSLHMVADYLYVEWWNTLVGVNTQVNTSMVIGLISQLWLRKKYPRWFTKCTSFFWFSLPYFSNILILCRQLHCRRCPRRWNPGHQFHPQLGRVWCRWGRAFLPRMVG